MDFDLAIKMILYCYVIHYEIIDFRFYYVIMVIDFPSVHNRFLVHDDLKI